MKNAGVALFLLLLFLFFAVQELAIAATITFTNNCSYTVWPGTMAAGDHVPQLSITGFELPIGASKSVNIPSPWSGRIWGRTGCSHDSGVFVCVTGDCGSGQVECNGAGASLPTTLVELKTASKRGQDLYHVSNVNGFNLPMSIAPKGGLGVCNSSSCPADVISECPEELQVRWSDGRVIACKSACLAFNKPKYCCTGDFNTTDKCQPTRYSQIFEEQCPDAYSYAYDNIRLNGSFTCSGGPSYNITFCPYYLRKTAPPGQHTIQITNRCNYTVWAAARPVGGGRQLDPGESWAIDVAAGTSGARIWARTSCNFDGSGRGQCQTGDCGGILQCTGYGTPPNTLAEFALNQFNNLDFYDISLVDGFNVPMEFSPISNGCSRGIQCTADINRECPNELKAPGGCNNPCTVFKKNQYCCSSGSCGPTNYSEFFKDRCPDAYSYPKDDQTSTFTCPGGTRYRVVFCP